MYVCQTEAKAFLKSTARITERKNRCPIQSLHGTTGGTFNARFFRHVIKQAYTFSWRQWTYFNCLSIFVV